MSEQNKSNGEFSQLPVIAIIALVVGFFVIQDTAFKSTRPAISSAEKISTEDVRSRLWQDPFEAVSLHRKKYAAQDSGSERVIMLRDKNTSEYTYQIEKEEKIIVSSINPRFAYQLDNNMPQQICNSGEPLAEAHSIEELRCQIQRDISNKEKNVIDLQVLAVMVPGGPYAEEKEWRLRSRYAVISGMANAGFIPKDAEHIGFVDFNHKCINAIKNKAKKKEKEKIDQFCDWPPYMPYEWFQPNKSNKQEKKEKANRVLVLWLDNHAYEQNENPINMLGKLKDEIMPQQMNNDNKFGKNRYAKINFNIIGPHDSTTLQRMYDEIAKVNPKELDVKGHKVDYIIKNQEKNYHQLTNSLIFSATATIDLPALTENIKKPENDQKKIDKNLAWLNNRIVRTISTHGKLAGTLLCELAFRGVIPFEPPLYSHFIKKECTPEGSFHIIRSNKPSHIVLIGELDTDYSRNLIQAIKNKIAYPHEPIPWVHTFTYLRGLDGINAEQTITTSNDEKKESDTSAPYLDKTIEELRRPVGPNQFDYLRRLEDEISLLHQSTLAEGGIKAIGIVGSDVYDKILILQALRKKFPSALFFSTDLDTRLLHPDEKKWTRNLIVASPFGLKLDKRLQKNTMPFRDNYQTALLLSTIFAVHCWKGEMEDCLKQHIKELDDQNNKRTHINDLLEEIQSSPRLFEIGNHHAVDQSHKFSESEYPLHPKSKNLSVISNAFIFIGLIIAILLLLLFQVPKIHRNYIIAPSVAFIIVAIIYIALQKYDSAIAETYSITNGISTWPANARRIFSIILIVFFFYYLITKLKQDNDKITKMYVLEEYVPELNKDKEKTKLSLGQLLLIDHWRKDTKEKKKETLQEKPIEFLTLWSEYRQFRKLKYCFIRVAWLSLLYLASVVLLLNTGFFEAPRFPYIPYRGETSFYVGTLILAVATFMYTMLIFTIADIAHLSSHFISLLTKKTVNWPKHVQEEDKNKYNLDIEIVKYKTFQDFVVRHAGAVNQFIYYPFVILFLIILSRSYYFDNWQYTPLYLIIASFTALVTFTSGYRLRRSALKARTHILEELNNKLYQENVNSDRVKLLIGEIKSIKVGPFLPLAQHPIVLSLLMPFGGVGGLYLIEYMVATT